MARVHNSVACFDLLSLVLFALCNLSSAGLAVGLLDEAAHLSMEDNCMAIRKEVHALSAEAFPLGLFQFLSQLRVGRVVVPSLCWLLAVTTKLLKHVWSGGPIEGGVGSTAQRGSGPARPQSRPNEPASPIGELPFHGFDHRN